MANNSLPHQVRQRVQSFLRKHGFNYAEWTDELACYHPGENAPSKAGDLDRSTHKYKEWADLEFFLYNELGVQDPIAFEVKR